MKILIAPMAMPTESQGPMSRARALAAEALKQGHEPAFCAAADPNYRPVKGVRNFFAPVPSFFGTPPWAGRILSYLARVLGIQNRVRVRSYEQVLHLLGITARRFFSHDVEALRQAIRAFQPDVVIAEFRLAAIVAAKLEQVPVVTDYSYPAQPSFASSPECSAGLRAYLRQKGLPAVHSALELFDWAQIKFVASSHDLEPIDGENVIHVGPLQQAGLPAAPGESPNRVIAYVGTGIVSPRRLLHVLSEAVEGTSFEVYLASKQLAPMHRGMLHVQPFFDFDALLPSAAVFIHHGGQNSVMQGLIQGVPQIIVPGNHFERGYNADSVAQLGAGVKLESEQFSPDEVRAWMDTFAADPSYRENARAAGQNLLKLGGAGKIIATLEHSYLRALVSVV
jgi:uncharacterized protein (TIGR00661 family)